MTTITLKSRWLLLLLGISLVGNLFWVGTLIGQNHSREAPPVRFTLRQLERNLPNEIRQELRATMELRRNELTRLNQRRQKANQRVARLMEETEVNHSAFQAAITEREQANHAFNLATTEVLSEIIPKLDVETRRRLMESRRRRR